MFVAVLWISVSEASESTQKVLLLGQLFTWSISIRFFLVGSHQNCHVCIKAPFFQQIRQLRWNGQNPTVQTTKTDSKKKIENLNGSITSKEIASILKKLFTKKSWGKHVSLIYSTIHLVEELTPINHRFFQKTKKWYSPTHSMRLVLPWYQNQK